MALNIIKNYLTKNRCYQQNRKRTPIGIQIHTIGTGQGTAASVAEYWNQSAVSACVTYCVDCDMAGKVLQLLPEETYTWADAGFGNKNLITVEICESDHMKYTSGASYKITNESKFKEDLLRGYHTAVLLCADICSRYGWDPMARLSNGLHLISSHDEGRRAGVSSAHVDPTHIWPKIGKTMDGFRADVKAAMAGTKGYDGKAGFQASDLQGLTEAERIAKIAPLYQESMAKTGMLASVGIAQFCLESGYGSTDLALKANNLHGMKASLSGNTWAGSVWDGKSVYTKKTAEQDKYGNEYYVTAAFRKYEKCEDSIADRAAYFTNAMNGSSKRYPGLAGETDYKKAIQIIKDGGYATDVKYVTKLVNLVERWNLYRYDEGIGMPNTGSGNILPDTEEPWYRVRLSWGTTISGQLGAYHDLERAKKAVDENPQYKVYDESGNVVYEVKKALYTVQAGSFTQKKNAEKLFRKIKKAGFDCIVKKVDGEWKVQCGVFEDRKNAETLVKELKKKGFAAIVK